MTTTKIEFEIPNDPRALRTIHDDSVTALDRLLAQAVPGGEVMHAIDPRRILTFQFGGPAVWSVGVASHASGYHQFLTYGLSKALDPAQPFDFELSMRVLSPGGAPSWPTLLLRTIARYHVSSGRQIKPGEFLDLGGPISQAPVNPQERHLMPSTRMTSILIVAGPTVPTPRGPLGIRNVVGLDRAELELLESCKAQRFCDELRRVDPNLSVALESPSHADNPAFRAAIEGHARSEGSDCKALCIPGLAFRDTGTAFEVQIPKESAARLHARLMSRLPFGEGLLLHGLEPGPGSEVLVVPGAGLDVPEHDANRLVLVMPPQSPHIQFLKGGDGAVWKLKYA